MKLGTRGSELALAQARLVEAALTGEPSEPMETLIFQTRGDSQLERALLEAPEAGAKGLFTRELEQALLDGRIDVAVHSLKDLPGRNPAGLALTAVLPRADTADVLLSLAETLPPDALIGTGSVRRARQLRHARPQNRLTPMRGNVPTRLRKLAAQPELDGIILARAGLDRLGFFTSGGGFDFEGRHYFAEDLSAFMLPAIGQGVIALQTRAEPMPALATINHAPTWGAVTAERALLNLLEGDCNLPVGVRTTFTDAQIAMAAILFPPEVGAAPRTAHAAAETPEALAREIFRQLTA